MDNKKTYERLYKTISGGFINCNVCDNSFNENEIKDHILNNHTNECYSCKNCKKNFIRQMDIRKHKKNELCLKKD